MENISENIIDNNNSNPVEIQKNMENFDRNMNAAQDSSKLISSSNVLNINQCDDISSHESCLNIYVSDKMNNQDSTINKENLDYLSTMLNSSVNIEFLTSNNNEKEDDWKNNWILKEAKAIFTTSVEMLIPAPKEDIHVSIDGKIMDEIISDISETGSDFEDTQHNINTAHDEILIDDNEKIHISHEIDNTLFQLGKTQHDFQNNNMTLENESEVNENISESENSEKQINKILHQTLNGSFEEPIIEPPERFNDENSYFDLTIQSISNSEIKTNINNTVNLEHINSETIIQYITREGVEESIKHEKTTMNNEEIQKDSQQNAQKSNESDNISVNQADTIIETSKENQINDSHCNCSGRENEYEKESYVAVQNNNKSGKMNLITEIIIESVNETIEQSSCDTDSKTTSNDNEVLNEINVRNENTPDSSTSTESELHPTLTNNEQIDENKVCSNETIIGWNETKISNDDPNTLGIELADVERNSTTDLIVNEKSENSNDNIQSVTSTLENETNKDVQVDENQCTQSKNYSEIEVVINQNIEIIENDKDQNTMITEAVSICMEFTPKDHRNNSTCKSISIIDQKMDNASIVTEQNDNSSIKQDLEQKLNSQNSTLELKVEEKLENSQEIEDIVKEEQSATDNLQPVIVTSQIGSNSDSHQTEIKVEKSDNKDKTNSKEIEDDSQNNNTDSITEETPQSIEPSTENHVDKSTCPMNDQVDAVSTVTDQKYTESAERCMEVNTEIVENIIDESNTSGTKQSDDKISTEQNSTLEIIVDEKLVNCNETDNRVKEENSETDNIQPVIVTSQIESNDDSQQAKIKVDESENKDNKTNSNEIEDVTQNVDIIQNDNADFIKATEKALQSVDPSTKDQNDTSICNRVSMNDQVDAVYTVTDGKDTESAEMPLEKRTEIVDDIIKQTNDESDTFLKKLVDDNISTERNSTLESSVIQNNNTDSINATEEAPQSLELSTEDHVDQSIGNSVLMNEQTNDASTVNDQKDTEPAEKSMEVNTEIVENIVEQTSDESSTSGTKQVDDIISTKQKITLESILHEKLSNSYETNDIVKEDQRSKDNLEPLVVTPEIEISQDCHQTENEVEESQTKDSKEDSKADVNAFVNVSQNVDIIQNNNTDSIKDTAETPEAPQSIEPSTEDRVNKSNCNGVSINDHTGHASTVTDQKDIESAEKSVEVTIEIVENIIEQRINESSTSGTNQIDGRISTEQNITLESIVIQINNTDLIKATEEAPQSVEPSTEDQADTSTCNSVPINDQVDAVSTATDQKDTEYAGKSMEVERESVENIIQQTSDEFSTSGMKQVDDRISTEQNITLESILQEKLSNSYETNDTAKEDQSSKDNFEPLVVTPEIESNQDRHQTENEVEESQNKVTKLDSEETLEVSHNVDIIQINNTDSIKATEEAPQSIEPSKEDQVDTSTCNSVPINDQVDAVSTVTDQKDNESAEKCMEVNTEIVDNIIEQISYEFSTSGMKQVDDRISTEQNIILESILQEKLSNSYETNDAAKEDQSSKDNFEPLVVTPEIESNQDRHQTENEVEESQNKVTKLDSEETLEVSHNVDIIQNNNTDSIKATEEAPQSIEPSKEDQVDTSTCNSVLMNEQTNDASTVNDQKDTEPAEKSMEVNTEIVENIIQQTSDEFSTSGMKQVDDRISTEQNITLESIFQEKLSNSYETNDTAKEDRSSKDNFEPLVVTPEIESNQDRHQTENEVEESQNKVTKLDSEETLEVSHNVDIIQNNNTDSIKATEEAPQSIEPSKEDQVDTSTCNSVPINDQVDAVSTVTDQKDNESAEKCMEVNTEIVDNIIEQTSYEFSTSGMKQVDDRISTEQNIISESTIHEKLLNSYETDSTVREDQKANANFESLVVTLEIASNQDRHQTENEVEESQNKVSKVDSEETLEVSQNVDIIQNNNTDSIKATEEAPQSVEPSTEDQVDTSTCNSVPINDQVDAVSTVTDQKDTEYAGKSTEVEGETVENIIERTSDESSTAGTKQVNDKISTEQKITLESTLQEKLSNSYETDHTAEKDQSSNDNFEPLVVTPEIESNQDRHQTENEVEESQTKASKVDSEETLEVSQNVDIIQNNNTDSIKATEEAPQYVEPSTEDQVDTSTCNSVPINDQVDAVSTVTDQKDTEYAGKSTEVEGETVENIIEQTSFEFSTSGMKQVDDRISTEQNIISESTLHEKLLNSYETDDSAEKDQTSKDNFEPLVVTPEIEINQDRHQSENEVEESQTKASKVDSEETLEVSQNEDIIQNNNTDSIKATEEAPQSIESSAEDPVDKSIGNSVLMNDKVDAVTTVTDQKDTESAEKCMEVNTEIVDNIIEQTNYELSTSGMKQVDDRISTEQNIISESTFHEKLSNSYETDSTVREDQKANDNFEPLVVTSEIESNQDRHQKENEVEESQTKASKVDSEETLEVSQNVDIIQNNNTDSIKATEEAPQSIEPSTEDHVDKTTCNNVPMNDEADTASTVTDQKDTESDEKSMEMAKETVKNIIEPIIDESSTSETKQVNDKISTKQKITLESTLHEKLSKTYETDNTVTGDHCSKDNLEPLVEKEQIEISQDCHQTENEVDESQTKASKADVNEIVDVSQNVDIIQNNNTDSIKDTAEAPGAPQSIEPSTEDHVNKSNCNGVSINDHTGHASTVTNQKDIESAEKSVEVTIEIVENIIEQRINETSTSRTNQIDDRISTEQNITLELIVIQINNTDLIKATEEAPQSLELSTEDHVDQSIGNSVLMNEQTNDASTVTDQKDTEPAEKSMEVNTKIVENIVEQTSDESSTSGTKQVDDRISTEQKFTSESTLQEKLSNSYETDDTAKEDQSSKDNFEPLVVTPEIESNQDRHQTENEVEESQNKVSKLDSEETLEVSQNVDIIQNNNTDSINATEEAPQSIEPSKEDQVDTSTCNSVPINDQVDAVSTVTDQKDTEYAGKSTEVEGETVENIIEQTSDESSTSGTKQVNDKISTEQNITLESTLQEKLSNSYETNNTAEKDQTSKDNFEPLVVTPEIESNQDRHQTENEVEESQTKASKVDSEETLEVSQNVDIIQNNNTDSIKATEEAPQSIESSAEDHVDKSIGNSVLMNDKVDAVTTVTDQKFTESAEKCMEVNTEIVDNIIEQTNYEFSTSGMKQVDDRISTEQNIISESTFHEKLSNSYETDSTVREDQKANDNFEPLVVTPEIESNQDRHQTENEVEESQTKASKVDSEETLEVSQNVDIIQNNNTDSIKATEETPQSIEPSTENHVDKSTCPMNDQVDAVSTVTDQKDTEFAEKCMEVNTEIVDNIINDSITSGTKQSDDKISTEQNSTLEIIVDEKLVNSHETDNRVKEDHSATDTIQPVIVISQIESNDDSHQAKIEVDESENKDNEANSNEIEDVGKNDDIIQNDNTDLIKPTEEASQSIGLSTEDEVNNSTYKSVLNNDQIDTNSSVTERKDISSVAQSTEVTKENVVDIIEEKKPTITTQSCYVINDKLSHNTDIHMISESVNNKKCGQLDCTNSESVIREEQSNERSDNFCDENKNEKSNICIEGSSSIIIVNKNFENNNSHSANSLTSNDDNDVIRIYDLNKQKKIIIKQDSTEKITKNTDSKSKPIPSKAHPSILSVTTKLQSRKIVTPAALKFLQPKRKIFEPEQIMSDLEGTSSPVFEKRDIMPTTASVINKTPEKTVIEPEVIPALPSVKALAKAFLLTSAKCSLKHPEKLKVKNDEENVSNDKHAKSSPDSYSPPYQQMKYNPIEPSLNQDENNVTGISETTSTVIFCNENNNDQENNNNVPADRPVSPVLGVGKLKTNIAFFENLKKN